MGDEAHVLDRDVEPLVHQLAEARLVALALGAGADDDIDNAVGMHRHLGALAGDAGRGVEVVGDGDAAQLATRGGRPRRAGKLFQSPERAAPSSWCDDSRRCRRSCRTRWCTETRCWRRDCGAGSRPGRSRARGTRGRSGAPSHTSLPDGRRCGRAASARCCSPRRGHGSARTESDRSSS